MQLYKCVLRLNGSLYNEVPKRDVTAAEIQVLRAIHEGPETGVETIVRIEATRKVDRSDKAERERLQELYGATLAKNPRLRSLNDILGHPSVPLPQSIPGIPESDAEPVKRRGRKPTIKLTPTEEALLRRKEEEDSAMTEDEAEEDTEIKQEEFA